MKKNIPEFATWAEENGLDPTFVVGVGFLSTETEKVYKGWAGYRDVVDEILYEYGICKDCGVHYSPAEDLNPLNHTMECACCVDSFRDTKIIQLVNGPQRQAMFNQPTQG